MFDMFTADQLFRLHDSLFRTATAVHSRMMGPDGHPQISVYSETWAVLAASHAELTETQQAVGDELRRRAKETVIMGNGQAVRVPDPICRAQGYCPTTRKCGCADA